MSRQPANLKPQNGNGLYDRIREILESARTNVARTVNTTQVVANWLIGREIVEEEQKGDVRAGYGENLLVRLSESIARDFGGGYSVQNLRFIRQLYLTYPVLITEHEIRYALRSEFASRLLSRGSDIRHAVRGEFEREVHSRAGPEKDICEPIQTASADGSRTAKRNPP